MPQVAKIQKRDGRIVDFDQERITEAIWKAAQSVGGTDRSSAEQISNQVVAVLEVFFKSTEQIPTVEQIQDLVEKILIEGGHAKTAKAYIIYRQKQKEARESKESILGEFGEGKAEEMLNFSNNALQVLKRRYLLRDEDGNLNETPQQMVRRIAKAIAKEDANYGKSEEEVAQTEERFYEMIKELEFLPNSPTIMNAGTELGQLSACFVLPVEDTMEGIFETLKHAALIHKSGGGTGYGFSRLRATNDLVQSTKGVASGPVSFMKVFDAATEVIKQGGKRRGANMGILRIDHPDVLDFINMKADMKTLQNFNISLAVTDKFMEALKNDAEYDLINPRTKEPIKKIRARMVFDVILANAWKNGDPGLIFIDEINRKSPVKHIGEIEATNPCGEQPLMGYESCNLGSINLNKFVNEDKTDLDWDRLKETVHLTAHFLDNVIDANHYPIPQIAEMTRSTRKIGLGVMGFADILYQLGIKYDSEEGIVMGEKVMKFIHEEATNKSMMMAEERGCFPAYPGSEYEANGIKMRNSCVTTVAPTGTIGMLAEASGGLEPNFAISFIKNVMDGTELVYTNKYFEDIAREKGFYSKDLMRKIAEVGTIQDFEEIPEEVRNVFVTAQDITPEWHIRMQAAFQKHVDSSVSKTINFPEHATISDIEQSYMLAFDLGCKGVTIYRDKSRDAQVLNIGKVNKKSEKKEEPTRTHSSEVKTAPVENKSQEVELPIENETREQSSMDMPKSQEVDLPSIESVSENNITARSEEFELPPVQPEPQKRHVGNTALLTKTEVKVETQKAMSKRELLESKQCPECTTGLQISEGCLLCPGCGFSACSV